MARSPSTGLRTRRGTALGSAAGWRSALGASREAAYYRWFGADTALERVVRPGERVLDVGCSDGRGSPVLDGRDSAGVDVYLPMLKVARESGRRNPVVQADIRRLPFRSHSFDVVASLDVIEHFEKVDALLVISELERVTCRAVVLMTPRGFVPQPPSEDQPWQEHRCGFDAGELRALGYQVAGQGGLASLRGAYGSFRGGTLGQLAAVAVAPIAHRFPHLAFHLIATREAGGAHLDDIVHPISRQDIISAGEAHQ